MAKQFLVPIDLNLLELQNVRLQSLSSDPSAAEAQIYYNTSTKKIRFYNGTAWVSLEDSGSVSGIIDVFGTAPIVATLDGNEVTISITAATDVAAGSMSSTDKAKLDAATNANTVSTIVMRDGSGNFSAGTITAALTGTASNAALLNNNNAAHYLARANHTGTQAASTISDLATVVQGYRLDQFAAPTSPVSLNSQKITGLAAPTDPTDAANKAYVDAARAGLDAKDSVRVATTASITLSGTQTIDGISVISGDRVLVKNQGTGSQNGIYVVAAGAWSRATDADVDAEVTSGMYTFVEDGTLNKGSGWVLTTNNPITVGTTTLTFAKFSSQGEILAGAGLTKTGNTIDVVGTSNRITVAADAIDIASTYVGQTSITTLGTITTGTWQGTAIAADRGGTGLTSYTTNNYIRAASSSTLEQRTPAQVLTDIGGAADNAVVKLTGNQSIDGVKTFTSTITGSVSGNAGTATVLATTRAINGVSFDGSAAITVPGNFTNRTTNESGHLAFIGITATGNQPLYTNTGLRVNPSTGTITATTFSGALSGNATTASTLQTARTINGTSFDGSANITITSNTTNALTAGDGLTSAGTFNGGAARTFALGTPGTLTGATTNAVTTTSHTHAITLNASDVGATAKYSATIGNGSATSFVVTHNLNSYDVIAAVWEAANDGEEVIVDIEKTSVNSITVTFAVAPASNAYRVVVIG